jgi:hypothetical protein
VDGVLKEPALGQVFQVIEPAGQSAIAVPLNEFG